MRSKNTAAVAVMKLSATRRRVVPFVVPAKPLFGEAVLPVPSRFVTHAGSETERKEEH
jgi:hypothetical protein